VRNKMPWIDRLSCDVREVGEACKAARHCPHGAFQVVKENGGEPGVWVDMEKCRRCGECSHACDRFAVKMI
jgi:heterodisulfide reductase subunit A-like polyferredoxin